MHAMLALIRFIWLAAVAIWLFRLVPRIAALARLGYPRPWLAVLPFGTEYAFADVALGDSDGLYVMGHRIPAGAVRWYGLICFMLYLVPVLGWITSVAFRVAAGGPCFAWALASLEGRDFDRENLKGAVTALFPTAGSVILIVAVARNDRP